MLTVLVLVCSLATTPDLADCNKDNAVDSMRVPEPAPTPAQCGMVGQAFVANITIGQELQADERVKIVCEHKKD